MRSLILIALGGAVAQLVDGSLGMGFGATSTTLLMALAMMNPASASATVHVAELGTTLVSGLSHWKFKNVDWGVVLRLGIPGAIGAFIGATLLAHISLTFAKPVTAGILTLIGISLVIRFARGRVAGKRAGIPRGRMLSALGLFGGFVDAAGGGGWGPVTSSTLLSIGREEPRRIIGTVNTAEFLVTLAASAGFLLAMWDELLQHLMAVGGLLLGGMVAAPIAAWLVSIVNPTVLGGFVGTTLVLTNMGYVLDAIPNHEQFAPLAYALVVLVGGGLSIRGMLANKKLTQRRRYYSEKMAPSTTH
ncbi:sulfite exporter TauE/SafE family protein [Rothia terrae]|uniref:sulfite exporter TauE/SafE family protein n=1 Tax=Rothia terrae TaxID=396015 RepID=UPI0038030A49